jgi:hypothetical protein
MRNFLRNVWHLIAVALLCLAPSAFAQSSVDMTLTSAGNNVLGGVYVGTYTATINGVSTQVICDDWADESYVNESWTAAVTNFSNLSSTLNTTKWSLTSSQQIQQYQEAAWLVLQMLNTATACPNKAGNCVGDISYAIWSVFDSSALNNLTKGSADYNNAVYWWQQAVSAYNNNQLSPSLFSNFLVYSPTGNYSCPGGCASTPPQEFLSIKASELPTPILLGVDILGLLGLVIVFRRRLLRPIL